MLVRTATCKSDMWSILYLTPFRDGGWPISCRCGGLLNGKLPHVCRSIATYSYVTGSTRLSMKHCGQGGKGPPSALVFGSRGAVPEGLWHEEKQKGEAEANNHRNNPDLGKKKSREITETHLPEHPPPVKRLYNGSTDEWH